MSNQDIEEPSWEEKYNRLTESLAKNKRLFSSAFAQDAIDRATEGGAA